MGAGKRIVIVGGVAGGASAAARARRLSEEAEIVLFERGEHISFANCGLPYHIGGAIPNRNRLLVQTPEAMHRRFRIDIRTQTKVVRIDREKKEVVARDLKEDREYRQPYDVLILSPGAAPLKPPIPGANLPAVFTLRNLADMDAIISRLCQDGCAQAVVVGAGYIGLELAEALRERGVGVTLVEQLRQVMAPADPEMTSLLNSELVSHGVDLRLETSVTEIHEKDDSLEVILSTGDSVSCGLVVLAVGVHPEVDLAREAALEIGEKGGIVVDDHMRTSDPAIFAVGDAVEVRDFVTGSPTLIPLAGPANRQGRIAADNAMGRDSVYRDTQGTAICKIFGLAIGMTGLSEKALKKAKVACEKVYVHPASHAGYYPGAAPTSLKLLFDPENGKILGAQAVGSAGIDKRIDVLAVAIRAGLTVFDLEHLELSYAPPYGSAKDPVNYAGFVAANVLRRDVRLCHVEDVVDLREDQFLLDVRTPMEVKAGGIPGAKNIPIDELRDRMKEIPSETEVLVVCHVGFRAYLACRILSQYGYQCRYLTGGYKTYKQFTAALPSPSVAPPPPTKEMKTDTGAEENSGNPGAGPGKLAARIDATGLQCPGPILQLSSALEKVASGDTVEITASDPGFREDISSWCRSTGHRLLKIATHDETYKATIAKGQPVSTAPGSSAASPKKKTIVVFSNDFDRVMAAFVIANGARSMGSEVTLFFTFWGLNVLRKPETVPVRKTLIESMFGWMMPRGADRLKLSKMNLGGMGLGMMKGIMRKKNVASLPELIRSAQKAGVRLVACTMTMAIMGIKREELIDGIEEGGVAMYLDHAESGTVNLFV